MAKVVLSLSKSFSLADHFGFCVALISLDNVVSALKSCFTIDTQIGTFVSVGEEMPADMKAQAHTFDLQGKLVLPVLPPTQSTKIGHFTETSPPGSSRCTHSCAGFWKDSVLSQP